MRRILLFAIGAGIALPLGLGVSAQQGNNPPPITRNPAEEQRARNEGLRAANDWLRAYGGYIRSVGQNRNEGLQAYGQLLVNFGQYRKLLAEAQLILAETRLTLARARREELNNELLYEQVLIFKQRADQYRRDIRRVRNEAARFRRDSYLAVEVRFGRTTPQNINAFVRVLKRIDILPVNESLWKVSDELPAESFQPISGSAERVPSFIGGNGYQLIDFLKSFRLSVVMGSPAHRYFDDIFMAIDGAIADHKQNLELKTDEMLANFLATIDQLGIPTDRLNRN